MYCDRRLGGVEDWHDCAPSDADMRVPDKLLDCACFLCVKDGDLVKPGGTAFLVYVPVGKFIFYYLVTAKHCVTKAFEKYGALYARINTASGSSELVKLNGTWACSDDEGVDIAVLPWIPDAKYALGSVDIRTSAFEGNLKANGIGIGNEVIVVGLFRLHYGSERNIPIVRHGILAAMPGEPLKEKHTNKPFKAYLAEIQSIGGLSGSPVFVFVPAMQLLAHHKNIEQRDAMRKRWPAGFLYLLGVIRGHFDAPQDDWIKDFEQESVHTGIAMVTPMDEVLSIVQNNKDLVKARTQRALEHQQEQSNAQTDDSAFEEPDRPFTQADFESALRKVSRRIQPLRSGEEK
jgi:hypothetical protein